MEDNLKIIPEKQIESDRIRKNLEISERTWKNGREHEKIRENKKKIWNNLKEFERIRDSLEESESIWENQKTIKGFERIRENLRES